MLAPAQLDYVGAAQSGEECPYWDGDNVPQHIASRYNSAHCNSRPGDKQHLSHLIVITDSLLLRKDSQPSLLGFGIAQTKSQEGHVLEENDPQKSSRVRASGFAESLCHHLKAEEGRKTWRPAAVPEVHLQRHRRPRKAFRQFGSRRPPLA